jgi:hypothetical protein
MLHDKIFLFSYVCSSWDSNELQARQPGFEYWQGQDFSLLLNVQTGSGAHPTTYPMGNRGSFPGGKADHSPPSSAEVKNGGAIPPLPHVSS